MSDSLRSKVDIDCSIFYKTGEKVPKVRQVQMDLPTQSLNLESDVDDFFESYSHDNLVSCEDLEDYCSRLGKLKQEFRRVHTQLKQGESEESYGQKYPRHAECLSKLSTHFRKASEKLSALRSAERTKQDEIEKLRSYLESERLKKELEALDDQKREKREQCVAQRSICIEEVEFAIKSCVWEMLTDPQIVIRKIASFEAFLGKFNDIRSSCRALVGNAFDVADLQLVQSIREHLASGNERLDSIRKEEQLTQLMNNENEAREKDLAEEFKIQEARRAEEEKIGNLLLCADTLVFEIKTRYDTLWKKCSIQFSELTDHEIFELKKRQDMISVELREMIDKISEFEKFVVPCGDSADGMRKRVSAMRNNCTTITGKYFQDLSDAITHRDISQKKLTNAAALTIKLSKFCGYESDLDIYSFRSDFR